MAPTAFFSLPRELRDKVYESLFQTEKPYHIANVNPYPWQDTIISATQQLRDVGNRALLTEGIAFLAEQRQLILIDVNAFRSIHDPTVESENDYMARYGFDTESVLANVRSLEYNLALWQARKGSIGNLPHMILHAPRIKALQVNYMRRCSRLGADSPNLGPGSTIVIGQGWIRGLKAIVRKTATYLAHVQYTISLAVTDVDETERETLSVEQVLQFWQSRSASATPEYHYTQISRALRLYQGEAQMLLGSV